MEKKDFLKYVGRKVELVNNKNAISIPVGTQVWIHGVGNKITSGIQCGLYPITISRESTAYGDYTIYSNQLKFQPTTIEELEDSIVNLKLEQAELSDKITLVKEQIAFCKDNKLAAFHEEAFKVYAIMKELNLGNDYEKAQRIVKILK